MYHYLLRDMSGYGFRRTYYAGVHPVYTNVIRLSKKEPAVFQSVEAAILRAQQLNKLGYEFKIEILEDISKIF